MLSHDERRSLIVTNLQNSVRQKINAINEICIIIFERQKRKANAVIAFGQNEEKNHITGSAEFLLCSNVSQ